MNKVLVILMSLIGFSGFAQKFTIPMVDYPFTDVIEWKGVGAILMSKNPNMTTPQINLTLVADKEVTIWDQKIRPKNKEFYYLSSENARYVYFLDNLELTKGKVYFNQLNSAGNVKTTSVSISSAIKKLGPYDYNKLELINVVVTDKALVHHFRYEDKKAKVIREFATFITHHNMLCYAVELDAIPTSDLKDENIGQWNYIGFTGNEIYFAARGYSSKKKGWSTRSYTSKGKEIQESFLEAPSDLLPIENIGFGTTGSYYLEEKHVVERGLLAQINGKMYLMGAVRSNGGAALILHVREEGEWKALNTMNLNYFIENKNLKLGIYPMNEGLGYHLDHNGYDKVSMIYFEAGQSSTHNDFSTRAIVNPSSTLYPKKKEEFTVNLPNLVLVFNTNQLGKEGEVEFEFKEK
ncbi:MAG: hypothetical protein HRT58_11475 [Crocinitomicaceae bacterium]|nr:hypothetical protein [Flavobacteriales bacterium]NQZ36278.1 hypothetical protein [Crocinitomicaceae bacterium]